MRRVASLYLPTLATDRLRKIDTKTGRQPDPPAAPPFDLDPPSLDTEASECSCPRGGGWRPGARWARSDVEAQIARLPLHQRPPLRELGRRSEAAEVPFRPMRSDEVGASRVLVQARADIVTGSPLVTVARTGQRIILAAVCRDAAALGLTPGMALTQARAMVPGLEVRDSDAHADTALLRRIGVYAARKWTPLVSFSGLDGLWFDLTGVAHLHGGERQFCATLLRFCSKLGLGARVAVASNGAAAHALARHGAERLMLCCNGEEAQALCGLPLDALRLDQTILAAMRRLGLERIADLVAMPRGPLARRFGSAVLARLDQALGRVAEPFDPIKPVEPLFSKLRFAEPIGSADAIVSALIKLMTMLIQQLLEHGQGVRALLLACERVDREVRHVSVGTARATRDDAHLLRLLTMKIETIDPGFGIETMRLTATATEPLGARAIATDLVMTQTSPDIAPLVDLLAGRLGGRALYRLGLVESEVPERSVRRIAPLDQPVAWPDRWPRPPRLLARPERVEHVLAELPDHPPRRFSWRGRTHLLVRGDGPERIHGEWWKRSGERESIRDYFRVEQEDGARFWIFRRGDGLDMRTGDLSWWIHGAFG